MGGAGRGPTRRGVAGVVVAAEVVGAARTGSRMTSVGDGGLQCGDDLLDVAGGEGGVERQAEDASAGLLGYRQAGRPGRERRLEMVGRVVDADPDARGA